MKNKLVMYLNSSISNNSINSPLQKIAKNEEDMCEKIH